MAVLHTLPEAAAVLPPSTDAGAATLAARSFFYAVFKHRRLVVGVFLLVFVAAGIAAFVRPRTWRAGTKVLVKLGETVQLAPAEAPSKSINLPLTPEVVNTEAEIVKSREVIAEAVARIGVQPEPGTTLDELISNMQLALTVAPTPASNVLQISYLGRYPDRAARMVNAITDVYLDKHNQVYRNEGVHTFYQEQLGILEGQMKAAQHRLRSYLRKTNVVDVDQEIHVLNQDLMEEDKGLKAHRAKMVGVQKKVEEVRSQLARTPAQVPYQEEYLSNPTIQTFKDKLATLELERFQALERYLPTDRHVTDKDEEIGRIQARIAAEKDRILNKATIQQSDLHKELERNAFSLDVLLADLRAREQPMVDRVAQLKKMLHDLRDQRFMISNLKQDADAKTYAFDLYWKKQEEARITEAMKNQQMVNVSVVERASPPLLPENGLLLPLLLGLVGGMGLATAMAVAVEYLNRRLRFEEEVERYLELPVLAVIPDLHTTPDIARA